MDNSLPDIPPDKAEIKRPGCLTLYVVLLGIALLGSALLAILSGVVGAASSSPYLTGSLLSIIGILIISILIFFYLRGLWRMRKWAGIAATVIHGLLLVLGLYALVAGTGNTASVSSASPSYQAGYAVGRVIGVGIEAYIVYWFFRHLVDFE